MIKRDRSRFSAPLAVSLINLADVRTVEKCQSIARHTAKRHRDIAAKRAKRAYAKAAGHTLAGHVIKPIKGA